jgi:hypothetical protein
MSVEWKKGVGCHVSGFGFGYSDLFYRRFRQRTDQPQAETEITEMN